MCIHAFSNRLNGTPGEQSIDEPVAGLANVFFGKSESPSYSPSWEGADSAPAPFAPVKGARRIAFQDDALLGGQQFTRTKPRPCLRRVLRRH